MTTMERRDLLKTAWIAPLILTWPVTPSMARAGSDDVQDRDHDDSPWRVTIYQDDAASAHWFHNGDYMIFGTGQVYVLRGDWIYIGLYGSSAGLPSDFPVLKDLANSYLITIEHI